MSSRTFTVFQDAPTSEAKRSRAASVSSALSPLSAKPMNASQATTLTTTEKENLHPVTGELAGTGNTTKKRKTSVLATKAQVPLSSKKQKEQKEPTSAPDAKKRKSATTSVVKVKAGVKKDGKPAASLRKGTKRVLRKASSLPKVDEEAEAERERGKVSQAEIDSRCYELTVKPLADLSQAYKQCSSLETLPTGDEKTKFRPVKVSGQFHANVPHMSLTMILHY